MAVLRPPPSSPNFNPFPGHSPPSPRYTFTYWFAFPALRSKDDVVCHASQPLAAQFDADSSRQLVAAIGDFRRANPLATAFIVTQFPLAIRPLTEIGQLDWSKAETEVGSEKNGEGSERRRGTQLTVILLFCTG